MDTSKAMGTTMRMACVGVVAGLLVASCQTSQEGVRFQTLRGSAWGSDTTTVAALFFKPEGNGPFPAVVLLHTDGGLKPHVTQDWPAYLTRKGYAVLTVDSFGPRGLRPGGDPHVKFVAQARDAYGALDYLVTRADIAPGRVGIMGFSSGAFAIAEYLMQAKVRGLGEHNYKAGIALYGGCRFLTADHRGYIPLYIIVAEHDVNLKSSCIRAIERDGFDGVILKNAYHGFDSQHPANAVDAGGNKMFFSAEEQDKHVN